MKRIFATGISQESNSFNPLKSTYDDFMIHKGQAFRNMAGVKTLISGGFEVIESIWARATPGGTLRFEDFMRLVDEMLAPLENDRIGFDGVFLPMHGALDVEHIGSGELFIANRIREIVGPKVPISAALDMHANIPYSLANACNIIYGFRTAPHIDVAETHVRAAELLMKAINENALPRTELIRIPLMMPGENMMSASGMGKEVIGALPGIEMCRDTWCASYFVGMAWVDCPQSGAAVVVSGLGAMDEGVGAAKELAAFVWDNRDEFKYSGLAAEPLEAVEFVAKNQASGLTILSDCADNVTAGAAGCNALMLKLFLAASIKNALFAAIIDPAAVALAAKHNIGDTIDIEIGAEFNALSEKVTLQGATIKKITSHDQADKPQSCVLSFQNIDILLFDKRKPVFMEETLNEHGLSLCDYEVLVVKQGYLSPELDAVAVSSVMALTPGNCNQKIERLTYKKVKRPIYPLDNVKDINL